MGATARRERVFLLVTALTLVLSLAACGASTPDGAQGSGERIDILNAFSFVGHNSPPFLAIQKGYFADEGIEAQIIESKGGSLILDLLTANPNATDKVGIVDLPAALISISNGAKIKAVAAFIQTSLNGNVYRTDRGITSPEDLEGKKVGWEPSGTDGILIPAALRRNGVDPEKVEVVGLEGLAAENAFIEGRIDAMAVFVNSQPPRIRDAGVDIGVWSIGELGVPMVGTGLVVPQAMIDQKPEVVRGLVRAILRAWADAKERPEEAIGAQAELQTVQIDTDLQLESLETVLPLIESEHGIGYQDSELWNETLDFMEEHAEDFGMQQRLPLDAYFTNEFLEED